MSAAIDSTRQLSVEPRSMGAYIVPLASGRRGVSGAGRGLLCSLEFVAVAYADQNDADYAAFTKTADEQRIEVERGV